MRIAECECGHLATDRSATVVAELIREHVVEVHPAMRVLELDVLEREIRKARRYGPSAAAIFLLYPKQTPWTAFFGRSTLAGGEGGIYVVRRKLSTERRDALWRVVHSLETPRGNQAHTFDHRTIACAFLDGGIVNVHPMYLGHSDTWVVSSDALRLLCYKLNLTAPRRLTGEERVLTGIELEAQQVLQRVDEWDALVDRLDRLLNR